MALITPDDLRVVLGKDEYPASKVPDVDLQTFIDSAHLLVTEELATSGLSADRQTLIEKYLAAHLAAMTYERGQITFSKTGDASEYYGFKAGQGLLSTRYGQQAVALDTSGKLAVIATPNSRAEFKVVGQYDPGYDPNRYTYSDVDVDYDP